MPRSRACYICGRQCLLPGFDNHVQQCRALFEKRESQKPPKERRKCPPDPYASSAYGGKLGGPAQSEETMNAAAFQAWSDSMLVPCRYCSRRFLPDKLIIHNKSCTAMRPARSVAESVGQREQNTLFTSGSQRVAHLTEVGSSAGMRDGSIKLGTAAQPRAKVTWGDDFGNGGIDESDYSYADNGNMASCPHCGRNFNSNSFAKHVKVCKKVFLSARKTFNSAKQRIEGTEIASFQRSAARVGGVGGGGGGSGSRRNASTRPAATSSTTTSRGGGGRKASNWRDQSNRFRQAMRESRMVARAEQKSKATGIPLYALLPPRSSSGGGGGGGGGVGYEPDVDPSFVQCPTCGRSFSQLAGARHIPQCKSIINKPSRLLRGSGLPSYSTLGDSSSSGSGGRVMFGHQPPSSGAGGRSSIASRGDYSATAPVRLGAASEGRGMERGAGGIGGGGGERGASIGTYPSSQRNNGYGDSFEAIMHENGQSRDDYRGKVSNSSSVGRGYGHGDSMKGSKHISATNYYQKEDPRRMSASSMLQQQQQQQHSQQQVPRAASRGSATIAVRRNGGSGSGSGSGSVGYGNHSTPGYASSARESSFGNRNRNVPAVGDDMQRPPSAGRSRRLSGYAGAVAGSSGLEPVRGEGTASRLTTFGGVVKSIR